MKSATKSRNSVLPSSSGHRRGLREIRMAARSFGDFAESTELLLLCHPEHVLGQASDVVDAAKHDQASTP